MHESIFPPVKPTALRILSHWIAFPSGLTGGGVHRIHPRKCRPLNLQEGREKEREYERSEREIKKSSACAGRARKNISRKAENWNMSCGWNSLLFFFFFFERERERGIPATPLWHRRLPPLRSDPLFPLPFTIFLYFYCYLFLSVSEYGIFILYEGKSLSICHNFPY